MSGFTSKDIRTIVLQSADPSLLFFISLFEGIPLLMCDESKSKL